MLRGVRASHFKKKRIYTMNCLCNLFDSDEFIWFLILAILIVCCNNGGCGCGCGCRG